MALNEYDAIVDNTRHGNYLTIQAADDALDGGPYNVYVKAGTYAGWTCSTDKARIVLEPGTVITSAIILSGAKCAIIIGAGSDIQALLTVSGAGGYVQCENGVDLDGVLLSGARSFIDGGGWDTLSDGTTAVVSISVTGVDSIVKNIVAQTTAGGGTTLDAVNVTGARAVISTVKIPDSDSNSITMATDGDMGLVSGVVCLGADGQGIRAVSGRIRIIGNYLKDIADDAINPASAAASNCLMVGNIIQDQGASCVDIAAAAENCVCVGNRTDGAVSDSSGTSTVAQNDETAF
jgi:hypothetical protein